MLYLNGGINGFHSKNNSLVGISFVDKVALLQYGKFF